MDDVATNEITIANINTLSPLVIFSEGGIKPVLDAIADEVSQDVPDTETPKGRKAIASNAHKVSQSKSLLEKLGKTLADDLNAQLKPINAERKLARDTLDQLRDTIRKPLTEWEREEEIRLETDRIKKEIEDCLEMAYLLNDKFDRDAKEAEKLATEARIAQEQADQKAQDERDDAIRKEAQEAARVEAERIAKTEHDKLEAEKSAAIEREQKAARDLIAAEEREKLNAELAEQNRLAAENKAEDEKLKAVEDERIRQQLEADREAREAQERADNKANAKRINNAAAKALSAECGLSVEDSKNVVIAIAKKSIPNVHISY